MDGQIEMANQTCGFITADGVAQLLGVSRKTVYRWHQLGILEGERVGPRLIRFRRQKVESWVSEGKGGLSHGN